MSYHANGAQVGEYWVLLANGTMSEDLYFPDTGTYRFEIIAKGSLAYGIGPEMGLIIDGEIKGTVFVNTSTPEIFVFDVEVSEGTHEFAIGYYNDLWEPSTGIDRNLYVDKTIITPSSIPTITRAGKIIPDHVLRNRWILIPALIFIEGTNTHFEQLSSLITFDPTTSVFALHSVVLSDTKICSLLLVMPSWYAGAENETVTVKVKTGTEVIFDTFEIEMFP